MHVTEGLAYEPFVSYVDSIDWYFGEVFYYTVKDNIFYPQPTRPQFSQYIIHEHLKQLTPFLWSFLCGTSTGANL